MSACGTQETISPAAGVRLLRCCGREIRQQRQISKAREIAIGSDLLLAMRRYLAVDSIFVWPESTRTASISPVPFKMWRAPEPHGPQELVEFASLAQA